MLNRLRFMCAQENADALCWLPTKLPETPSANVCLQLAVSMIYGGIIFNVAVLGGWYGTHSLMYQVSQDVSIQQKEFYSDTY
jgi:hypothetical protein